MECNDISVTLLFKKEHSLFGRSISSFFSVVSRFDDHFRLLLPMWTKHSHFLAGRHAWTSWAPIDMIFDNSDWFTFVKAKIAVEIVFFLVLLLHVHEPYLLQVPGSGAELDEMFIQAAAASFTDVRILTAVHNIITKIFIVSFRVVACFNDT